MSLPEPDRIIELARLADEACKLTWNHEVLLAIQEHGSDEALRLASAFRYPNNDHRPGEKGHFGPTFVMVDDGEMQPLTLEDTPDDTCDIWEAVAAEATHPRLLSTLHDLLFERRRCDHLGDHGRAAGDAYVAYAQEPSSTLAEVDSLRRAFELSKLMKNDALRNRALPVALSNIARTLADHDEPKPGVSLRLLEILIDHGCEAKEIDDLLEQARSAYPDVWNAAQILDMKRRRSADPATLEDLDREEVQAYLDEAAQSNPLTRIIHLETAARIARERGVRGLGDEAIRALQNTNVEDIPLQRFSTEVEIPREQTQAQIEQLLGEAPTWLEAAMRIVGSGPPSLTFRTSRESFAPPPFVVVDDVEGEGFELSGEVFELAGVVEPGLVVA